MVPLLLFDCSRPPSEPAGGDAPDPSPSMSAFAPPPGEAPAVGADGPSSMRDRIQFARRAGHSPRPDLAAVSAPALTAALQDPERLWVFMTSKETPYLERRAAGAQGGKVFPLANLPRLMAAIGQLRAEESRYRWGLGENPFDTRFFPSAQPAPRVMVVLGQPWTPPDHVVDYPLTWDEEAAAPWPWQVQVTLDDLFRSLLPHSAGEAKPWLEACLALPWSTDDEASLFVEASRGSTHFKIPRIMARWRAIALSPRLPAAASLVAEAVGTATIQWEAPESQAFGQVLTVDILERSPHPNVREQAVFGLRRLTTRFRDGKKELLAPPATAVLKVLGMALDPRNGSARYRLHVHAGSAFAAMPTPPFALDRSMELTETEAEARLRDLTKWFQANQARLAAEAAREAGALDQARAALEAEERTTPAAR